MQNESFASSTWQALSDEFAGTVERAGRAVVAVHARRRIPASGVHWRPGIVVTADHAIQRREDIAVTLADGQTVAATLAGRDPRTDLAILRVDNASIPTAEIGDVTTLKPGHLVLAAARTNEGTTRACLAMIAVVGPAWHTWSRGVLDHTLRLDRGLHPNFSGGPALDSSGRVLGISTSRLSSYAAVLIPPSTVERVVAELDKKGRIGRGYLGVSMQPVRLPRKLREPLGLTAKTAVMVVSIEPESPAEKAGVLLGDVLVGLDGATIEDIEQVHDYLTAEHIGKPVTASIIRGGNLVQVVIQIEERPAAH
jgi:serine protease DegQ